MKLDPINKIVYLDTNDNLGQVIFVLKKLYPEGEWENLKIEVGYSYSTSWHTTILDTQQCPEGYICDSGDCVPIDQSIYKTYIPNIK